MLPRSSLVLLTTIIIAAGCGDDGGGATIDAPGVADAARDGSPDADPSLLPLIGTWNRAPEADPGVGFDSITFHGNGTTTTMGNGMTSQGVYAVPSTGRVRLGDGMQTIETDFVVGNNHLILTAFLPQGTVNGLVGTWKNSTTSNGTATLVTTMDVRADQSGTMTTTGPSGSQSMVGTWAPESTGFAFTIPGQFPVTYHFRSIGTQAIGYLLLVRA